MEKKVLKRKWARAALVLWCLAVGLLAVSLLLELFCDPFGAAREIAGYIGFAGLACLVPANLFWLCKLRCPCCGRGTPPLRWSYRDDFYCMYCGKPFPFDDGPGEDRRTMTDDGKEGDGWPSTRSGTCTSP